MSGLNVSLGYLLAVMGLGLGVGLPLRFRPLWWFTAELPASFVLAACWMEVQTLVEVGQWAGGFGPDVAVTILFLILVVHGVISQGSTGNPTVSLMSFLARESTAVTAVFGIAAQFLGAFLAHLLTTFYWSLELTDMHMIKNLMSRECSPALRVSVLQGVFTEAVCALTFHLLYMNVRHRAALFRIPLTAMTLAFLSYAASGYTSGLLNPSLAYALTFHCPGFTRLQYMTVYWFGPIAGVTLALFLYLGHIPRIFTRNLLYSQKSRFRVPKAKGSADQAERTERGQGDKKGD